MKKINIKNLSFAYASGQKVFEDFSLELQAGEGKGKVTAIMGASGTGKTTLLKLLLGVERSSAGKIDFSGESPVMAYVPQEPVLFEHLSIAENARYFQFSGAYKKHFNEQLFHNVAQQLGISHLLESRKTVTELSGGQRQRLSLLRALSINPDLLLLDEPSNGLDAGVKRSFLNKLREIANDHDLFVLYVTHHKLEAQIIADEVVYLVQAGQSNNLVRSAVVGDITDFSLRPPVLDAAQIFRFPDVKIAPVMIGPGGDFELTGDEDQITNYLLLDDLNLKITKDQGTAFTVMSRSPIYTLVRHEDSGTEWMLSSNFISNFETGSKVYLKFDGDILTYDRSGLLVKQL